MTEEEVRRIVRDEIEAEMLKDEGVLDKVREVTINALKQMGYDRFVPPMAERH